MTIAAFEAGRPPTGWPAGSCVLSTVVTFIQQFTS
jgi:hypothetical protein